jgi:DNA-binding transcriptional ArsR family regulator
MGAKGVFEEDSNVSSEDLIKALSHRARRQILRTLHRGDEPRSPVELAKDVGVGLSSLSYHMRVLADRGMVTLKRTRPVRGSIEHFYTSAISENETVVLLLQSSEAEDVTHT